MAQYISGMRLRPKTHLSSRDREILALAAQGLRSKQIARALWLSDTTP